MANRLLGVISALPEEFAHLSDQSALADQSGTAQQIGGLSFWRGAIGQNYFFAGAPTPN